MTFNQLQRIDLAVRRRLTLADFAARLADLWGDRVLVDEFGGERLTFADAARCVERWSNGIAASIAHPITLSRVMGRLRIRLPVAWYTALLIAAATPTRPISPIPLAPRAFT